MQTMSMSVPALNVINGRPTALSTQVAEFFGKLHKNVIRDIRNLIESIPELGRLNFELSSYINEQGKELPCYRMDRKGFVLLAMGFTGEQALKFKIAYIDAFDEMEERLKNRDNVSRVETLTPAQQLLVRQAVASRAKTESKHYHTIYRAIYNRFQIARYDQLPQTELNECLKFINSVNLDVPEMYQENVIKRDPSRKDLLMLTTKDCDGLINVIYCHRYLFRREMEVFHEFLRLVKSPMAGRFFEYMRDPSLMTLEWILERAGYKVEKLDCYQHLISNK